MNWNLLANNAWNASCYSVRNLYLTALANLNATCVALFAVSCVADSSCANFLTGTTNGVVNNLCAALRNDLAYGVVLRTSTWLTSVASTYGVVNSLCAWLADVAASRVVNSLATWLADIAASCVVYGLATALRNHFACLPSDDACLALRNHFANGVRNYFCVTLWNLTAYCVRNFTSAALTLVAGAVNNFLLASWNPDLLADRAWATLNADGLTLARASNCAARCCVVVRSRRTTNCFTHHWTRNSLSCCLP